MKRTTTKLSENSRKNLRLIAAKTGEKMYEVMDRLSNKEAKRLKLA